MIINPGYNFEDENMNMSEAELEVMREIDTLEDVLKDQNHSDYDDEYENDYDDYDYDDYEYDYDDEEYGAEEY